MFLYSRSQEEDSIQTCFMEFLRKQSRCVIHLDGRKKGNIVPSLARPVSEGGKTDLSTCCRGLCGLIQPGHSKRACLWLLHENVTYNLTFAYVLWICVPFLGVTTKYVCVLFIWHVFRCGSNHSLLWPCFCNILVPVFSWVEERWIQFVKRKCLYSHFAPSPFYFTPYIHMGARENMQRFRKILIFKKL
jgi:hypothetical protein